MKRLVALTFTLVATAGLAFWAPNHQDMNVQVLKEGTPWGDDITRGGKPLSHFGDYLQRVLYVSAEPLLPKADIAPLSKDATDQCVQGRKDVVQGVPFENAESAGRIIERPPCARMVPLRRLRSGLPRRGR